MPRTVEISVSAAKAKDAIARLQSVDGVVGIQHQPGASIQPRGDVVTIHTTDDGLISVSRILDKLGIDDSGSVITSEPRSLVAPAHARKIDDETNEAGLEEMASMLRRETNISNNYVLAMALAGAVAAAGLWTDTVHIVIGAMVIAPGFEPLLRIPFGLLAFGRPRLYRGLASSAAGYGALALGAAITALILQLIDPKTGAALAQQTWMQFWTSVTESGVLIALLASAAGMAIIAAQRSVLSAGVMIALALVPGMAIFGMGIATGELGLAGQGLMRWAADAAAVLSVGAAVLVVKRAFIHRRVSLG